jgi:pimeloyl-ACP methyl ester carboxylesterase
LNPRTVAKVDFSRTDRVPMLFIANGRDHVIPPSVTTAIHHENHKNSAALVEYVEYPDRPHFPGVPGWEEVADHALSWAVDNANT